MLPSSYFAPRYFPAHYFPKTGSGTVVAPVPGAADYDALAAAFDAALSGPMRAVVTALLTGRGDVWRNPEVSGGKRSAPVLHASDVPCRLATADASALQLLADLGAEKANRIVRMRYDADILEGDELRIGSVIYQVERVAVARDKTLCAVWEVRS